MKALNSGALLKKHPAVHLGMIAMICAFACVSFTAYSQTQATAQKGAPTTMHAAGPFEVKLAPQDDKIDPSLGRMTIDKQYHGDLEGTGKRTDAHGRQSRSKRLRSLCGD